VSPFTAFLLVLAGIGGGLSGSIAGLASLVSYPALLALGLPPISANVTNTVAMVFQGVGTIAGSRPELRGAGRFLRRMLIWSVPGGILGGVLLLVTPSDAFEKLVPVLIGSAALAVLLRPGRARAADTDTDTDQGAETAYTAGPANITTGKLISTDARTDARSPAGSANAPTTDHLPTPSSKPLLVGTFLVSIYGGYFGAAAGVMLLALLLSLTDLSLPRAGAVRSLTLNAANAVAAVYFAVFGPVDWAFAVPLAVGFLIGGRIGPVVVRHAPAGPLRVLIAVTGLGLALQLAAEAFL